MKIMSRNVEDVGLVADAAVTRDHVRAALLQVRRHGDVEHLVQAVEIAVDAAAGGEIDGGILRRHEQVAGDEHVGAAEVDEDVAVTVRRRSDRERQPRR